MADPIQTDFIKQTLIAPLPGLFEETPEERTEKSKNNNSAADKDLRTLVNQLGQTVKIFS